MYARVSYSKGDPSRLDSTVPFVRDRVLPLQRQAEGFGGIVIAANRDSGEGVAVTYWETLAAMNTFERQGQELRRQAAQQLDMGLVDVDRFEVVFADRKGQPAAPSFVRSNELYADPRNIERALEFIRTTVQPNVSALPGYRSLIGLVNRMTGRTVVVSGWESAQARAGSEAAVSGQRQQVMQIAGAGSVRVDEYEALIIEILTPARVS
jgi:heme-degrading monooxygenase HmoA